MSEVVNYDDIRESLDMILRRQEDIGNVENLDEILDELDDAIGNNADHLVLDEDLRVVVESGVVRDGC